MRQLKSLATHASHLPLSGQVVATWCVLHVLHHHHDSSRHSHQGFFSTKYILLQFSIGSIFTIFPQIFLNWKSIPLAALQWQCHNPLPCSHCFGLYLYLQCHHSICIVSIVFALSPQYLHCHYSIRSSIKESGVELIIGARSCGWGDTTSTWHSGLTLPTNYTVYSQCTCILVFALSMVVLCLLCSCIWIIIRYHCVAGMHCIWIQFVFVILVICWWWLRLWWE